MHAEAAGQLAALHGDPFDRMLVAQAECEDLMLVTADKDIPKYQVRVLLNSRAGAFIGIINIVAALHPHLSGLLTDPEIREPLVSCQR